MAFINNLGVISLNRGDCLKTPLFINIGTEEEPIRLDFKKFPDVEIYFGVYLPGCTFEQSFIGKKFTFLDSNEYGDVIISIDPQDTLYIKPGKYKYAIRARMYNSEFGEFLYTVVDQNDFYIT